MNKAMPFKKISGSNSDIEKTLAKMKEEVEDFFKMLHNIDNPALFLRKESDSNKLAVVKYRAHYFINKIESIGKKEVE